MKTVINFVTDPAITLFIGMALATVVALWVRHIERDLARQEMLDHLSSGKPFRFADRMFVANQWGMTESQKREWLTQLRDEVDGDIRRELMKPLAHVAQAAGRHWRFGDRQRPVFVHRLSARGPEMPDSRRHVGKSPALFAPYAGAVGQEDDGYPD